MAEVMQIRAINSTIGVTVTRGMRQVKNKKLPRTKDTNKKTGQYVPRSDVTRGRVQI